MNERKKEKEEEEVEQKNEEFKIRIRNKMPFTKKYTQVGSSRSNLYRFT
jgi:hypothetical protein